MYLAQQEQADNNYSTMELYIEDLERILGDYHKLHLRGQPVKYGYKHAVKCFYNIISVIEDETQQDIGVVHNKKDEWKTLIKHWIREGSVDGISDVLADAVHSVHSHYDNQ